MSLVGGVIFDRSILFSEPNEYRLLPPSTRLLRKLCLSNIPIAISYGLDLSPHEVAELKRIAGEYSCECFLLDASVDGAVNEISTAWSGVSGSILFVVSDNKDAFHKLDSQWLIIVVDGNVCDSSSMLYINTLEELPLAILRLNKKLAML